MPAQMVALFFSAWSYAARPVLLAALLSAVAVALAARTFANARLNGAALLRVLGLPQRTIAGAYVVEFFIIGLLASVLGVTLGFAMHYMFVWLMAGLL